jgi:hypothetical protein
MGGVMFCPNCGTRQEGQPRFCFSCGHDLSAAIAARASVPDQQPAPPPPGPAATPPAMAAAAPQPPALPAAPPVSVAPPAVAPPAWSVPANQPQFQAPNPYAAPGYGGPGYAAPASGHAGTFGARPTGIAILAILEVVGGVLGLWAAKLLFDVVDVRNYYYGDGGTYQLIAFASIAGAAAGFVLAYGLWQLRPWAWLLGCGLCIASAAIYVLALVNNGNGSAGSAVINIGIDAAVLYYLNTNGVRAVFGRPPTTFLQLQGPQGPR